METTRTARRLATAALALAATLSLAPATAGAADHEQPVNAAGPGGLELTLSGSEGTWARAVRLSCPTGTGTHPHPFAACADLARAGGDVDRIPSADGVCTMIYDPVTATAHGTFHGKPVEWEKTFPNACVLQDKTGNLFRF